MGEWRTSIELCSPSNRHAHNTEPKNEFICGLFVSSKLRTFLSVKYSQKSHSNLQWLVIWMRKFYKHTHTNTSYGNWMNAHCTCNDRAFCRLYAVRGRMGEFMDVFIRIECPTHAQCRMQQKLNANPSHITFRWSGRKWQWHLFFYIVLHFSALFLTHQNYEYPRMGPLHTPTFSLFVFKDSIFHMKYKPTNPHYIHVGSTRRTHHQIMKICCIQSVTYPFSCFHHFYNIFIGEFKLKFYFHLLFVMGKNLDVCIEKAKWWCVTTLNVVDIWPLKNFQLNRRFRAPNETRIMTKRRKGKYISQIEPFRLPTLNSAAAAAAGFYLLFNGIVL